MSPKRAPRPCAEPGCPELVHQTRCAEHTHEVRAAYDNARGTAAQRGYGSAWRRYRERFLADNPFCGHCRDEGVVKAANEVDHIEPVYGPDDPGFWDETNHQGLCRPHHRKKTAEEGRTAQPARPRAKEAAWTFA